MEFLMNSLYLTANTKQIMVYLYNIANSIHINTNSLNGEFQNESSSEVDEDNEEHSQNTTLPGQEYLNNSNLMQTHYSSNCVLKAI